MSENCLIDYLIKTIIYVVNTIKENSDITSLSSEFTDSLDGFQFRFGSVQAHFEAHESREYTVTFDHPFPNECLGVIIQNRFQASGYVAVPEVLTKNGFTFATVVSAASSYDSTVYYLAYGK